MSTFDRRYEQIPRLELEQMQLERLQALLARLRRNVRRYREKLGDFRLQSLGDLHRLPFTTQEDMVESFPYGMFAFPLREVIRLHTTLGPNGKPLVLGHTRNALAHWGRLVARQLAASGVTANDVILISLGGLTQSGAVGYVRGAELIEASVIAEDPLHIDYQLAMLQNYRPTILITTPTHALARTRAPAARRIDLMAKVMRDARVEDVWQFISPADLLRHRDALFARLGWHRGMWEFLYNRWVSNDLLKTTTDSHAGPGRVS